MKRIRVTLPVDDDFNMENGCEGCPAFDVDAMVIGDRFVRTEYLCPLGVMFGSNGCPMVSGEVVDDKVSV